MVTGNPFDVLGLKGTAGADEIRTAYRTLVKKCHPDHFLDADEQKAAQEKMIALNLAYEEALRLAVPARSTYRQQLTQQEAVDLASKALSKGNPQSALAQLGRTPDREGPWFFMQGQALMDMEQYESAHHAFRAAIHFEPDNLDFRRRALDAALAMKEAQTLAGKLKHLLHIRR